MFVHLVKDFVSIISYGINSPMCPSTALTFSSAQQLIYCSIKSFKCDTGHRHINVILHSNKLCAQIVHIYRAISSH